ncbi:hypothetical protein FACS189487_09380 [Campylobacterota bacterium]|nr:hypothetical protein FACS189487_09380 [Campylobacterota bacterium]
MQVGAQNLSGLNYQLSLNYQESLKQATFKSGNNLYAVELRTVSLEFNLSVSTLSKGQFDVQNEWQRIADELMKNAPKFPTTPEEAAAVIGEDGFYGIKQTSQRMAQFVLQGAGDNEDMLRAGRAGVIDGFKAAEKIWGGKLPEISYKTLENALKLIDDRLTELGLPILKDIEA